MKRAIYFIVFFIAGLAVLEIGSRAFFAIRFANASFLLFPYKSSLAYNLVERGSPAPPPTAPPRRGFLRRSAKLPPSAIRKITSPSVSNSNSNRLCSRREK